MDLIGIIISIKKKKKKKALTPELRVRITQKEAELRDEREKEPTTSLEHLDPAPLAAHHPQYSSK